MNKLKTWISTPLRTAQLDRLTEAKCAKSDKPPTLCLHVLFHSIKSSQKAGIRFGSIYD